jgi:hypothetical protein
MRKSKFTEEQIVGLVAYLTAQIALDEAGFAPGKTVFTQRSAARSATLPTSWRRHSVRPQ